MILFDAIYINSKGGINLLKYFLKESEKKSFDVLFAIDSRLESIVFSSKIDIIYIKPNIFSRHIFYLKNKNKFRSVFCFANIPPTFSMKCSVYTYFQNVNLLNVKNEFNLNSFLKNFFYYLFSKNSDYWIVQTNTTAKLLSKRFESSKKIKIIPFFNPNPFLNYNNVSKNKNISMFRFFYPSSGEPHKNHLNLIAAFKNFSFSNPNSTLVLTIGHKYKKLIYQIETLKKEGVKIINKGMLNNKNLLKEFQLSDFIIFPSLRESFGLGLIEAALIKKPIIASDLDYVHEIVDPSITFNPHSIKSIEEAMKKCSYTDLELPKLKVKNNIEQIFELLNYE